MIKLFFISIVLLGVEARAMSPQEIVKQNMMAQIYAILHPHDTHTMAENQTLINTWEVHPAAISSVELQKKKMAHIDRLNQALVRKKITTNK